MNVGEATNECLTIEERDSMSDMFEISYNLFEIRTIFFENNFLNSYNF